MDPARLDEQFTEPELQSDDRGLAIPLPPPIWRRRRKFQDRRSLHLALFLLTVATTTVVGAGWYAAFQSDFGAHVTIPPYTTLLVRGCWYSVTILAILGCHEMGHYLTCRYYDVDASLPYFIPVPFLLTGTMGAFIRIREPIPTKRQLFDIGIAGPLAGFAVAVPALFLGVWMSRVSLLPEKLTDGWSFGEPLLFKLATRVVWGTIPDGYGLNMHPMAFAAWFGLLATALNLFPIGQLDGGHISYSVLGRKSSQVTLVMVGIALVLTYFSTSWLVWTALIVGMLFRFGRHHPRTYDEDVPLDRSRTILAVVALVMFVLCFTPAPIEPAQLIR